jgi:hypothetical protein
MKYLASFGHFWFDFIVGDDWTVAVAVAIAMALTTFLAHHGRNPWYLLPTAVLVTLTWSVWRVARVQAQRRR